MTRVGSALLTLVCGASLAVGCSGATARDINFNTDAESGFEPPPPEAASETNDTGNVDATAGAAGGAAGAAGGAAGAAGNAAGAAGNVVSDGGNG